MSRRQHHGHGPRTSRHDGRAYRPARRPFETPVDAATRTPPPAEPSAPPAPPSSVAPPPPTAVPWGPPAPIRPTNGHAAPVDAAANGDGPASGATAPQFRRFIKSRAYVPMHELRRRFGINGMEDDVTPVELDAGRVYVGLPAREGGLLGELLRGGEVGYELSLDPCTPVVIGVYPMRPVPRH